MCDRGYPTPHHYFFTILYCDTQLVPDLASGSAFQAGAGALLILCALPDLPLSQRRSEDLPSLPSPVSGWWSREGAAAGGLGSRCAQVPWGVALPGSLSERC